MASYRYQVFITPLISLDVYGDEVEITDYVDAVTVSDIQGAIDSYNSDFDFGVYTFGRINLRLVNDRGRFSDPPDTRSLFTFTRDLAKIRINFYETGTDQTGTISFKGLIADEATQWDFKTNAMTITVLTNESILRSMLIPDGYIVGTDGLHDAIKKILNQNRVKAVLTYDADNIVPATENWTIDVPTYFDGMNAWDALKELTLASCSVLYVDKSNAVHVKNRAQNQTADYSQFQAFFYGAGDLAGRENILDLTGYSAGMARVINACLVNGQLVEDSTSEAIWGTRRKELSFDFITDSSAEQGIANTVLTWHKWPKVEMEITVPTRLADSLEFLDMVSVYFPFRFTPSGSNPLPICGIAIAGQAVLGATIGETISELKGWKIIGKKENVKTFETVLKLRNIGYAENDGEVNAEG